jgi:hypothetical protein
LQQAKWGIGTRDSAFIGAIKPADGTTDKRTALGVDLSSKKLWIAVFEAATQEEVRHILTRAGAQRVMILDGGSSSSLYFGRLANGVAHGLRFGGQRPVATVFGIKADPIIDAR